MRKLKRILLIGVAVLALTQTSGATGKSEEPTSVRSKYKNLFVFKTDRKFKGAQVEVLSSDGARVTSQTLEKRKMIIDFCDVKQGSYTIRISKGDRVKEFQYEKK
jgi:hypothetical protein